MNDSCWKFAAAIGGPVVVLGVTHLLVDPEGFKEVVIHVVDAFKEVGPSLIERLPFPRRRQSV